MRLISYILTFWVLLLSCIPCSDQATTSPAAIQFTAAAADRHTPADACSPFCICACCATNPVLSEQMVYTHCSSDVSVSPTSRCFSFIQEVLIDVWQPPQWV
jgi:hypothetical protein